MRTTLTLDDDVAKAIERLRKQRDATLKEIVNEALRVGLEALERPRVRRRKFRSDTVSLGRVKLANLDDIAEALSHAEGDPFA